MDRITNKELCTGCAACGSACPLGIIKLIPDSEGFAYPVVDNDMCTKCGVCEEACPLNVTFINKKNPKCYAARSTQNEIVGSSSSGGVFSELAVNTIARGGVVVGAAYVGEKLTVRHIAIDNLNDLSLLRGSKYVQSDIGNVYKLVKRNLRENRPVLFSGTPCQVAGLQSFLGKPYEFLLKVEVICHGVPPPKLFDMLKDDLERAHGQLIGISFRDKSEGWGSRAITGWYKKCGKLRERGKYNAYFRAFIEHLTLRKSCENCVFNDGKSGADITLGDFWGIGRVAPEFNDDKGVSAVILHTTKGAEAFAQTKCISKEVDLADITLCNPSYQAKRSANLLRSDFMSQVYDIGIGAAVKKYMPQVRTSIIRRIYRRLKRLIFTK